MSFIPSCVTWAQLVDQILNTDKPDFDLRGLVQQIEDHLAHYESDHPRREKPTSEKFAELSSVPEDSSLEDPISTIVIEIAKEIKSYSGDNYETGIRVLNAIRNVHWIAAGFLIVGGALKVADTFVSIPQECLRLFRSMFNLSKIILQCERPSNIKREMENELSESIQLIVEGAILCYSSMKRKLIKRVFKASKLPQLASDLDDMCQVILLRKDACLLNTIQNNLTDDMRPSSIVGIEKNIEEVIQLLDCENDRATTSVLVYGIAGSGKTTLADAAYVSLKEKLLLEGWKHSKIVLIEYLERNPKIEELQSQILKDFIGTNIIVEDFQTGRQLLKDIIEKEPVFLYIDDALYLEPLEKLLPSDLSSAKKLRLLLTARERTVSGVAECCGVRPCKAYPMQPLSVEAALQILCRKIDRESEIDFILQTRPQVRGIAEKCNSCPLFLEVIGSYIHERKGQAEAYDRVLNWLKSGDAFSGRREEYRFDEQRIMFAFDCLGPSAQKAFLDICSHYSGNLEWEKVALDVGKEEMACLQESALIKNEDGRIKMHSLILAAGRNKLKRNQEKIVKQISPGSKVEEKIVSGDDFGGDWKLSEMEELQRSSSASKDVQSGLMVCPTPLPTLEKDADKLKFRAEPTEADANNKTRICHFCKMEFLTDGALDEHIRSHRQERRRQLWQGDSSTAKYCSSHFDSLTSTVWSSDPSNSTDWPTDASISEEREADWPADTSPSTEWVADPSTSKDWLTDWLASSSTSKDWLVEWLEDSSNSTSWQHREPGNVLQASSSPSIIRKVHPYLRALRPESYDPKKVGLGIYHHDMSTYSSEMGEEKLKALCITAKRIKNTTVDNLVAEIQALDLQIRECYPDGEENPPEEILSWNIAMDTCFVLEFFRSSYRFSVHINDKELMVDIFKLENQIPLFLLKKILEMEFQTSEEVISKLAHMLCMNPQIAILPFSVKPMKLDIILTEIETIIKEDPCHLLHLLSRIIEASFKSSDIYIDGTGIDSCIDIVNGWMDLMSAAVMDEDVDIAHKFLIRFKRSTDGQVRFKRGWFGTSVIYLPPIYLSHDTEPLFWNLIALAAESESNIIGHFIFFMKCIINLNNKNAALLRGKQIIVSERSDEEIVRMFENISNVICQSCGPFENVWGQVKEHHSSPLNTRMLGFTYLLSWVALIRFILLILTTTFGFVMR